jgi:signal transduction histidine kinase
MRFFTIVTLDLSFDCMERVLGCWKDDMKEKIFGLGLLYAKTLERYLKLRVGASLHPSKKLGRQAVDLGLETLDLARIHEKALLLLHLSDRSKAERERATVFFNEANTQISETHFAALQEKTVLSRLDKSLRQRTEKLAANKVMLQRGLIQRKEVEQAIKQSRAHFTKLLKESLVLQEGLRQLTYQLLAEQEGEREEISHTLQDEIAQTLLGINVRLLCLKQEAHSKTQGLKNEIANTQKMVLNSVKSVRKAAHKIKTR